MVELSDAPAELKIPWLLLPPESFLPGIAVADRRLLSVLERSGAGVRVLGEYIESDDVYLVQASPFVSQETLSRVGRVLWSSGSTHIISVAGDIRKTAPLPGLRSRLLMPVEEKLSYVRAREWGGRQYERVASSELLPPTPTEEQWIDQMVASVSQAEIEGTMRSLTGVEGVNVPAGLDTIWTRYSYHPDCVIAAEHLYGQFDSLGLDVAFDSFFGVPLKSAAFKGPEGYAAGGNGVVYHTSDGGDTWEKQDAGTGNNLWKASAIAGDTCWISGGFGELIRTSDGGETWEQLVSGTSYYLYGVEFVNSQVGWVCGDGGLIKKSTNGGVDWSTQVSHTIQRLYDIEFTDLNNGWAVGNSGGILRTSDGGANWEVRTDVTTERMYDVCFVDSLHGWAVGAAGVIVHTSDGGEVWQYQYSGLPSALMSVSFVDTQVGWAVGSAGIIMHTENAGATWTQQPSGSYVILYGVCCIDASHGWAVGNGSVVRTVDGETWPSINDNMPDQWRNVVATMTGTTYPSSYYVVCGHYDSISDDPMVRAPGADDNATGASVVLEAARVLKDFPFRSSMKFICFSGEEQGLLGSNHYAGDARLAGHDIDGVLNFDMVGYGTPNIYLYCDGQSEWLANYCVAARDTFVPWLDLTKSLDPSMRYSDHAMFWDRGYSALLGIEIDYLTNPWYHSTGDVMDYLTLSFTTDVARLAVASLASLAGLDTTLISVAEVPPPDPGLRLGRNYPNPFNPLTSIPFSLPPTSTPANYVLAILDPAGRIVRILETGLTCATPLDRTAVWDGTDESGRHVASGVYLSFLRCGDDVRAQKIVLAR
ncbi:MAG: M28 family peptidase [Candidatus Eisenbacteria bacterium]|nr:M28 family peptidase [Candidatus Eisenbacteria bacterium]